ncbi:transposase family protein [Streptomyces europaeiscabiei]|uniref:Transposase family protein n=1 Tax=Streptomyces europaeiscabiei TaxID=146819 RepID=A0ABU4NV30_9ACTN|nr:transposase family protein [Streptomyces europaeiscabiei]MDX2524673.1 transposase family protein [Streptomyces europaeiscabiei]MDX2769149.1 transposase family protein [Streptomyces europaeiscabiei]MDX3548505.1 transposase family protein [Streptomyces europaeiscabiei]MDX3558148.1 transposase family protein [Streptomyces europaeiscabiei]MDX3705977.1 transposase family protein [Streptomyces europaeiscabiei]
MAEPGCCGPPPPDRRAARRSPPAATTAWSADSAAGLAAIADLGFVGLDGGGDNSSDPVVITGYKKPKGKKLPPAKKQVTQLIAAERAVCEHAFAHLKNWRVLTRLRLDVKWATRLVRALMVLNWHEIAR